MPTPTDTSPTASNTGTTALSGLADAARGGPWTVGRNGISPLAHTTVLRAHGADSDEFLQGQISADLRQLDPTHAKLAAYSSPKGRMLATLQLMRRGDAVLIKLHDSVAMTTLKRLRMFVLRAQVTLEDVSSELPGLGLWGPEAENTLAALGLPVPQQALDVVTQATLQLVRHHTSAGIGPRFELRGPAADIGALWPRLAAHANPVSDAAWRAQDILAGVATIYPETSDHFVAQMTNLDLLGGISFDKGCYTGQEVIARLHYLGRLKRRMLLLRSAPPAPAPGTVIYAHGQAQSVGEVVDAAADGDGNCAIAAVLKLDHARSDSLRLGSADGPALPRPGVFAPGRPPIETE